MVERIGLIGAGLIGQAWAVVFARAGYEVKLYDAKPEVLQAGSDYIRAAVQDLAEAEFLPLSETSMVTARIHPVGDLASAVRDSTYVQESTYEDLAVKREVLREIEREAKNGTIIASSTSSLLPSALSDGLDRREMFVVAHPVNPPHLIPFVEIVPAPWTAPETTSRTFTLLREVGQAPVLLKREIPGFLLNRLQVALVNEAISLVNEGYATVGEVDLAVSHGLGYRWAFMGPFETIDLNAPGGIRDYLQRFQTMYSLAREMTPQAPFGEEMLEKLEAQRRSILSDAEMAGRRRWRDQRLMKVAKGLR